MEMHLTGVTSTDSSRHGSSQPRPLILTLGVDADAQQRWDGERKRHFPSRLNRIPAHISLFHALPGEEEASIREALVQAAEGCPAFPLEVHDLMRLGRGVAYSVRAPELDRLHAALRAVWLPWLSRQDQQPFRPHVVIQNKVDPEEAKTLYTRLTGTFRPWTVEAESLLLWHYEGGPWRAAGEFRFASTGAGQ